MPDQFTDKIYAYVAKIPPGKVMTYGDIARALGRPAAARSVGSILRRNPNPFYKMSTGGIRTRRNDAAVPCHRVVRADLKIGGYSGGVNAKKDLLKKEGVKIIGNRVAPQHVQNPLARL